MSKPGDLRLCEESQDGIWKYFGVCWRYRYSEALDERGYGLWILRGYVFIVDSGEHTSPWSWIV